MSKQIPELTIITTPTAGQESLIETVVARHDTYETSRMTLAQIFTLGSISGSIKVALDALSSLIATNTSDITNLGTTKLDKNAATRTWLTANRAIITDGTGVETYLTGTTTQVIGFDGAGKPIAVAPSVDINGQTLKATPIGADEALIADSASSFAVKRITLNSFLSPFWDGSDGDVTISTNTTLVRDMYYRNLTINSTIVLDPNGYKIFVSETFTNNGIVRRNGNVWWTGTSIWWAYGSIPAWATLNQWSLNAEAAWGTSGASNGAGGTHLWVAWTSSSPSYTTINGVAWGTSTSFYGSASTGWAGWTSTRWSLYNVAYNSVQAICALTNPASFNLSATQYKWPSGSGGGWTDSNASNVGFYGGWAGSNWWAIFICAKTINNTSWLIESKWWNWWAGGGGTSDWGGGGGGWQGWVVILIYVTLTAIGTITLTWGTGWAKWGTGAATAGASWNTGITIQIPITI